jgi:DNA-binding transcriptional LysR family regulator
MSQLEDMQTFVRIVEAGSITKAADQLDTVKSAISKRLSELEKRLGVTLLTRTTRTQALTETGRTYYQQCVRIIDQVTEVESGLRQENCALTGRIKIAGPLSFGLAHLAPALRRFTEINPEVEFEIDFNDRRVDLVEAGFDLAVRIGSLTDSSLMARQLTKGKTMLCASPGYLASHGRPLTARDLETGHVRLKYTLSPEKWLLLDESGNKVSPKIASVLSANNGDFLLEEAINGRGLVFSPDFLCYKAIRLGLLVPILADQLVDNDIGVYAVYPQTRHLPNRVRSLIDYLVVYYGATPYWQLPA